MHFDTATAQLAALRARRVSAAELLEATLARIDALNPALNAVVVQDREGARRAAAEADAALARGEQGPLLGLPMTVKECFDIAGLPTTWGLPGTEKLPVTRDAVVVQRLRAAGAVVLGKTNVPPNLADWQSANPVYGRTNNPWDPARTPGGSSGGSAAALAAGLAALEMGSDIGGSLRVPAHCCGVYAHKPSHGIVPMRGNAPPGTPVLSVDQHVDLAVGGPMARSAADLALALDVVAGPDEDRAVGWRLQLPPPRHTTLKGCRVLLLRSHPLLPTGHEVADIVERWAVQAAAAGARIVESHPLLPDLLKVARTYGHLLLAFFGATFPAAEYEDLKRAAAALPPGDDSPQTADLRAFVSSHRDWLAADRRRTAIRHGWRQLFAEVDVVVAPVMPLPALPHDSAPMEERTIDLDGRTLPYTLLSAWAGPATVAGLPATAFPVGLSAGGLPVGLQAIGPQFEDRTPIAFAAACEAAFGGFRAPPGYA